MGCGVVRGVVRGVLDGFVSGIRVQNLKTKKILRDSTESGRDDSASMEEVGAHERHRTAWLFKTTGIRSTPARSDYLHRGLYNLMMPCMIKEDDPAHPCHHHQDIRASQDVCSYISSLQSISIPPPCWVTFGHVLPSAYTRGKGQLASTSPGES